MTPGEFDRDPFDPDRIEVLDLVAFPTRESAGTWPCARCGEPHRIVESWSVRIRNLDGRHERSVVVCGDCAEELRVRNTED